MLGISTLPIHKPSDLRFDNDPSPGLRRLGICFVAHTLAVAVVGVTTRWTNWLRVFVQSAKLPVNPGGGMFMGTRRAVRATTIYQVPAAGMDGTAYTWVITAI
jgi:hypothetical protein